MKGIHDSDYLYATGRIRVLEGFLLNRDRAARLLEAKGEDSARKILSECGYQSEAPVNLSTLENMLSSERSRVFDAIDTMLPDRRLVDVFRIRYDMHNVKALLKSNSPSAKIQPPLLNCGRIPPERLRYLLQERKLKELPEGMCRAAEEAYEILGRTGDSLLMDIALDKACLRDMLALSLDLGDSFLKDYVHLTVDAANLKILVRGRRMEKSTAFLRQTLIPGGLIPLDSFRHTISEAAITDAYSGTPLEKAASRGTAGLSGNAPLYSLDLACDNVLVTHLKSARNVAFGIQPVAAYLAAKEFELINLRMIFSGLLSGYEPHRILERIRDHYV